MILRFQAILILVWFVVVPSVGADTTIEGVVSLPAPRPERALNPRYQSNIDDSLAAANPPAAIVYLEGDFGGIKRTPSPTPAEMSQKNFAFSPDLVAVPIGGTVHFPNLDDTYHNVFSYSKPKRFDLGRFRKDEKPGSIMFDKPGLVTVHCEIHDRMRGMILVMESPFFEKTDSHGRYRLEHLPSGHFVAKAWITENDVRAIPVDLKEGATVHIDFHEK